MKNFDCELKDDTIIVNPTGYFEVIEFFDYNCNHCKAQAKILREFVRSGKSIRLVKRPIVILGKVSCSATQIGYAIMMSEPDKFLAFLDSIMDNPKNDESQIKKALQDAEIDIEKLKKVLADNKQKIIELVKSNMNLAHEIGVIGAPAFLINGKLRLGELNIDELNKEFNTVNNMF